MQVCHSGPNAEADLGKVRAPGRPIVDIIAAKPYIAQQSMLGAMEPKEVSRYWKTEFFAGSSRDYLDSFRQGALGVTTPCHSRSSSTWPGR
jgi:hypothetical protein